MTNETVMFNEAVFLLGDLEADRDQYLEADDLVGCRRAERQMALVHAAIGGVEWARNQLTIKLDELENRLQMIEEQRKEKQ